MTKVKKHSRLKKLAMALICAVVAGVVLQGFDVKNVYAANLILTGDTVGLRLTPENEDLFSIDAMLPGESASSSIQIRNTDNYAFNLSVEVKNMQAPDDDADLLDVLNIKVLRDNTEIAGFPAAGGSYSLGRFAPGATATLDIAVGLDGREISNEYQAKNSELQWIFTAVSDYTEGGGDTPGDTPSGGGGGGGSIITVNSPPAEPAVTIGDDTVPFGIPENPAETLSEETTLDAEDADELELSDDEVPRGAKEMPKTGELSLLYYILAGIAISSLGVIILRRTNWKV